MRSTRFRFVVGLLAVAALLALAAPVRAQSAIAGKILNGTQGGDARVERVNLIRIGNGMSTVESLQDVAGNFRFELKEAGPYMVQVQYQSTTYITRVPPAGASVATVEITVYDESEDASVLRLSIPHLIVIVDGAVLRVTKVYDILNPTSPPRAITGEPGAFRFDMPDNATVVSASVTSLGMPLRQEPTSPKDDRGMTIGQSIKPGRTRYELSYELPYAGSIDFTERLYHGADHVNAIVLPDTVEVEIDGLVANGVVERDGIRYFGFSGEGLATDSVLAFRVRGVGVAPTMPGASRTEPGADRGDAPALDGDVQAVENRVGRGWRKYGLSGLFLVVLLTTMIVALVRPPTDLLVPKTVARRDDFGSSRSNAGFAGSARAETHAIYALDVRAAQLVDEIAVLDSRLAAGAVEASEHERRRKELLTLVRDELSQRTWSQRSG